MNTERHPQLQRRAALHAALGDSGRLQIVDALLLGDVSPQHLATLTGMGSNLVAHHLGVLEAQGLITRSRSQGDRRRTYIHLVGDGLDELRFPSRQADRRVLFVCTANSARSQLAAALWRKASDVPADSAGTHPAERIEPRAIAVARRHHLALPRRRPRRLDLNEGADLVVTVCDQAHEELERSSTGAGLAALVGPRPGRTRQRRRVRGRLRRNRGARATPARRQVARDVDQGEP